MKRGAVIIGVNKTGNLPVLKAAASGAREFACWADKHGLEVTLLTDENGQSISISKIIEAISSFVEKKTFTQLVVFFSGHGILRGPDTELWLLSGAPSNSNEAVNVPKSIWNARNSGISHIVVISDACRSWTTTSLFSQVEGCVIFPNKNPSPARPEVDVFYATIPGDPAIEARVANSNNEYHGIFTKCLLKGLSGKVPEVIEQVNVSTPRWIIPSWNLKPYLEKEVPTFAAKIDIQLEQNPDIRVESHPPNYLAEVPPPAIPYGGTPHKQYAIGSTTPTVSFRQVFKMYKRPGEYEHIPEQPKFPKEFQPAINRLLKAKGRESFETRTGFTVIGANVIKAIVTGEIDFHLFQEKNAHQIRVREDNNFRQAKSILLQFAGGNGIALAVLPGFIGTVVVEDERVVNVNYTPSRGTDKYSEYQHAESQIEQRRAFVAVAARNGSLRLEPEEADKVASYLRVLKSFDPTLGIYAVYAYAQSGSLEGVKSVYDYMSQEREPVLFDVALLAEELPNLQPLYDNRIAPFCPMLTQGWSFLEPDQELIPAAVRQAGQHLVPALWTTFDSKGVDILWLSIKRGELV